MFASRVEQWTVLALAAGVVSAGAALVCRVSADEPATAAAASGSDRRVAELRKQYPYVSLRARLAYESGHVSRTQEPKLSEMAAAALNSREIDPPFDWHSVRARSLEQLHSDQAEKFVNSPGFGFGRTLNLNPSPSELPYEPPQPLPLAETPTLPDGEQYAAAVPLAFHVKRVFAKLQLPAQEQLTAFHERGAQSFVWPPSLGHVRDVDHVAGFEPHAFTAAPVVIEPIPESKEPPAELWLIGRLELVSLLKHEEPVAYVSAHLPRMQELASDDVPTRPLTHVESRLLGQLHDGEQIAAEATSNRIRMLGALRASRQCMECHQVPRGALLGAFSYELQRDPPVPVRRSEPDRST
jgi:hypothetical protein